MVLEHSSVCAELKPTVVVCRPQKSQENSVAKSPPAPRMLSQRNYIEVTCQSEGSEKVESKRRIQVVALAVGEVVGLEEAGYSIVSNILLII